MNVRCGIRVGSVMLVLSTSTACSVMDTNAATKEHRFEYAQVAGKTQHCAVERLDCSAQTTALLNAPDDVSYQTRARVVASGSGTGNEVSVPTASNHTKAQN